MAELGPDRRTIVENADASQAPAKSAVEGVIKTVATAGNSLLSLLTGLLAAFLILYSGYVLYDTFYTQNQAFTSSLDLLQYKPATLEELSNGLVPLDAGSGSGALSNINRDYRAWLTVYNTRIDYPVLQGENDLFYANHDIYGNSSLTGSIYLAHGNSGDFSDSYNIVYGHHMSNGAMFGALDDFASASYFNSHREGIILTSGGVYDLKTFAVISTDAYESMIYNPGNRNLTEIKNYIAAHAIVSDMSAADGAERIVILSTCADGSTNGRLVLCAVMNQRELEVTATGYTGVYDGAEHQLPTPTSNYTDGTTYQYSVSTDGGATWSDWATTRPSIKDVGEFLVKVQASNSVYGTVESTPVTMKVTAKAVTVTADNSGKTYGETDPAFTASATGLIDSDNIDINDFFAVTRPGAGTDEDAATYTGALLPAANAAWTASVHSANYTVTVVNGDFTINKAAMTVDVTGYNEPYDGDGHGPTVDVSDVPPGSTVEYSTDGGTTWTTYDPNDPSDPNAPSVTDVDDSTTIIIRVTNPNYETYTSPEVPLTVTKAAITVTANDSSKFYGESDPTFSASAAGLVASDGIDINDFVDVTRPGAGTDESAAAYPDALIPAMNAAWAADPRSANYAVTLENGDFEIKKATMTVDVTGYNEPYDGDEHGPTVDMSDVPPGSTVEYSTDGGTTWTTTPPTVKDVDDSTTVIIRVTNPDYETYTSPEVPLTVTKATVTVRANNSGKLYGENDPTPFTATATGLAAPDGININDFVTVTRPGAGTDENARNYPGALVPAMNAAWAADPRSANYTVTLQNGDFLISKSDIPLNLTPFVGPYDGEEHSITVNLADLPAGTTVEYSTDGVNWSPDNPTATDTADSTTVYVRATNPNFTDVIKQAPLTITKRAVTVIANDSSKYYGENDPAFSASAPGLVASDGIDINDFVAVTRPGAGTAAKEKAQTYPGALVPAMNAAWAADPRSANYTVTLQNGDFEIKKASMSVDVTGFDGPYDGDPHGPTVDMSDVPPGSTVEYSTDGGNTWTTYDPNDPNDPNAPSVTDVADSTTVIIRVTNPDYEPFVSPELPLTVSPRTLTVTAENKEKTLGENDPDFTATAEGLVPGDNIAIAQFVNVTRPGAGTDENAATYPGALVPAMNAAWTADPRSANYAVVLVNGDFEIKKATMNVGVTPYSQPYDGQPHTITVNQADIPAGSTVEYSTDGGVTWLPNNPAITNVADSTTVIVRITNPNYETFISAPIALTVTPKAVTVTARDYSWAADEDMPELEADADGLLGNDTLAYTVSIRDGIDAGEPGEYEGGVVVTGNVNQGNYTVTYVPGNLEITEAEIIEDIQEPRTPLAQFVNQFQPTGSSYGGNCWALLNLIALIITAYLFIPLLHLRQKFGRVKMMKKVNRAKQQLREARELAEQERQEKERIERTALDSREDETNTEPVTEEEFTSAVETLYYQVKKFLRRFRTGMGLELLDVAAALVLFILTEDMRTPMVIIDKWTPAMLILLGICWIVDVRLARYRSKVLAEEAEELEAERQKVEATSGV